MSIRTIGFGLLALATAGCSSQQVYDSTSELRAQECNKLEPRERADCQQRARTPYPEYSKERAEAAAGAGH
ncbi:hypothetical protein [Solimonas fluminis]|uniref:hypothetical protein n=1 Tax=Solimonas fluminis TaxID=2086571 RepID=UPI001A9C757C|nr:hypothetical protein [Solimonas fluminis]